MEHFWLCLTGPSMVTCTQLAARESGSIALVYSAVSDIKVKLPLREGEGKSLYGQQAVFAKYCSR